MLAQMVKRQAAMTSEGLITFALCAAHAFDHLSPDLHRRKGVELGVRSQDVAKVNVEEMAVLRQHDILQMSVPNAQ